jgi:pimeloyl-ACP methyl ester carboxylesterase
MNKYVKYLLYTFLGFLLLLLLVSWSGVVDMRADPVKVNKERKTLGLAPLHQQSVDVGTRTLSTIIGGDTSSSVALLFLHGSPGSWDASSIYLNDSSLQQYLLLAPDRPGYGESDFGWTLPSLRGQAILVHQLMRQWPERRFVLIGHSYGCSLAQQLAFDYPDEVAAVVHVAPPLDPELEFGIGWRKFFNLGVFRVFTPTAFRVCNEELITLQADLQELLPRWSSLQVPVYLIQGAKDNLVAPEEMDFFRKMAPVEMQHLHPHPGDHFIYWTEKDFVLEVIRNAIGE